MILHGNESQEIMEEHSKWLREWYLIKLGHNTIKFIECVQLNGTIYGRCVCRQRQLEVSFW